MEEDETFDEFYAKLKDIMGLGLLGKGGKSKNLALKGIEEEIEDSEDKDESEDEDEDDDEDEDLTIITDEIKIGRASCKERV